MKKYLGLFIYMLFFLTFIFLVKKITVQGEKQEKELMEKIANYKDLYMSYEFEGKVIELKREGRRDYLYIKSIKGLINFQGEYVLGIEKVRDSILKVEFSGMLLFPNCHIPLKKGGFVYKKRGSSIIYYKYNGKIYKLSDIYNRKICAIDLYCD
jgi:hypothetical protein